MNLIYTNETGKRVAIGSSFPYLLKKLEGVSGVDVEITQSKAPGQRGVTYHDAVLSDRLISMQIEVIADNYEELEYRRRELLSVFQPLIGGEVTLKGKTIKCKVAQSPTFEERDYLFVKCSIVLACADPYFLGLLESIELSEVEPLFSFPINIPASGMELATLALGGTWIYNDSEDMLPVTIEIDGPVQTPTLTNRNTGEFIRVKTPILAGETMYITTHFGNKQVYIVDANGVKRDAFGHIDLDSTFWSLALGENYIKFDADVGFDNAKIRMKYNKRYLGV